MSKKILLSLKNISKHFNSSMAVDTINLDIYESEIFCLLGASGCGKTTLLRMIAGFEMPTSGEIVIDGVAMNEVPPYERPTNMMFQSYALFPHMTVEENVEYGLKREQLKKEEIDDRVNNILIMVKLSKLRKRSVNQLSGGQQQRVALARSLIKRPKLLLLDEPLGALDKKLREETQFEITTLQEKLKIAFIVVTHDQEEAMILSHRVGVMREGNIIQIGTPEEIYEYPNSTFAANFIGTVNIYKGVVDGVQEKHNTIMCLDNKDIRIVASHENDTYSKEQSVWVAIRPEKITITSSPRSDSKNIFKGTVVGVAYFGSKTSYVVDVSGMLFKVSDENYTRDTDPNFCKNETVYLAWKESAVMILTN